MSYRQKMCKPSRYVIGYSGQLQPGHFSVINCSE